MISRSFVVAGLIAPALMTAALACSQHSATEIADAIRNSPNANAGMRSSSCMWGGAGAAESGNA